MFANRAIIVLIQTSIFFLFSCNPTVKQSNSTEINSNSPTSEQLNKKAKIFFYEKTHDFGSVTQGEKVSYSFKFKNTGKGDLVISGARASCGCTVPSFPKKPVGPNKEASIDVVFDSENLMGISEKNILVFSNSDSSSLVSLMITSNVIKPNITKQ